MSDKKTSDENAASAISGVDFFRGVQGGLNVKFTFTQVQTWIATFTPTLTGNNTFTGIDLFTSQLLVAPAATAAVVTRFGTTNVTPNEQVNGISDNGSARLVSRFSNDASPARMFIAKSRGATVGAHTIVNNGDNIGSIHFGASDGTNIVDATAIAAFVASAPGANNMPTNLKFYNNRGSSTVTYTFGSYSNGFVNIGTDIAPDALLTINQNAAASTTIDGGTVLHLIGADGVGASFLEFDTYGQIPVFKGRRANGTQAAKTALVNGDFTFVFGAAGWDTAAYNTGGQLSSNARETYSPTARGTSFSIYTTALTTTTLAETVRFQPSGGSSFGNGSVGTDPGAGNVLIQNAIQLGSFTVGTLPAGVTGRQVFCSNARMFNGAGVQEGGGAGTGGMVSYNGTAWKVVGTNSTAVA